MRFFVNIVRVSLFRIGEIIIFQNVDSERKFAGHSNNLKLKTIQVNIGDSHFCYDPQLSIHNTSNCNHKKKRVRKLI